MQLKVIFLAIATMSASTFAAPAEALAAMAPEECVYFVGGCLSVQCLVAGLNVSAASANAAHRHATCGV
ncbi:hypothetical protein V502_05853 [Pseudogymnoascus sp. VKM F-4520 (FW-2644)]|nr:hypothetical protein V502_05853 [Pseudogymnoascus sp. VKM F-4520 (FW-2644)]